MAADAEPMTRPCERCGELGCRPELHPDQDGALAWSATTGALLGATVLGLLALPAWLRRMPATDAPEGHPRQRQRQDRVVTAVVSAAMMAVLTIAALTVAVLEHRRGERLSGWAGGAELTAPPAYDELGEIVHLLVDGAADEGALGMEQLLAIAPSVSADGVYRLTLAHAELGERSAPEGALRQRAIREALRRNEGPTASEALADLYDGIDDPVERDRTLAALGRCASPEALERVIESEIDRYRTPRLAAQLNVGCVQHVAHALLTLARAHRPERPSIYLALASACDYQPARMRSSAGAAIAEAWLRVGELPDAERSSPALHRLAHTLACADEALLDEALATVPSGVDEWTRAELELATFRRGRIELATLLEHAADDPPLRRQLEAHYQGSAPWQDAVVGQSTRERPAR